MSKIQMKPLYILLTATLLMSITSCLKDDNNDNEAQEKSQILQYVKNKGITATPSISGLYYIPLDSAKGTDSGPKLTSDYVLFDYAVYDLNDKIIDTSDTTMARENNIMPLLKFGGPYLMSMYSGQPGLIEGIAKMKPGERAKLIIPSKLLLSSTPKVFIVTLRKVIKDMKQYEQSQISNYLDTCKLIAGLGKQFDDSTKSGIYYIETKAGTGLSPINDDSVHIAYSGKTIDGKKFEEFTNMKLRLGTGVYMPAFEEGIKLMKPGGKAIIIIPFYKGYKDSARPNNDNQIILQPYSTLVFEVTLTSVSKK